jgi:hypothetical protein
MINMLVWSSVLIGKPVRVDSVHYLPATKINRSALIKMTLAISLESQKVFVSDVFQSGVFR